jgi:nucleotide-binding universal stress UspA family protein
MTTILVGADGTERSSDAVALARDLATATGTEVVLAHAVSYPSVALVADGISAVVPPEAIQAAEERLAETAAPVRDNGLTVDCVARSSVSPPRFLQEQAEERHAALIVVGSTHSSRWGRVLPGSTGERLLHGAPCAVAIAPAGYAASEERTWRRIAVAFDGSDEARAALRAGAGLAGLLGARLDVVTVLDVTGFGSPALMGGPGFDRTRADLEDAARRHLDSTIAELPAAVAPAGRLLTGDPAEQLAEASESCDLMLAGSRAYGPLRAVLLGGVSGRLARRSACPLIITPRGVEAPLAALLDLATTGASGP